MKKTIAVIWGLFTLLPIVYFIYFMGFGFANFGVPGKSHEEIEAAFELMFRLHMFTMFLIFGLLFAYIVYLFKTEHVPKDKKALWAVVLFLGNMVSMPVFWFLYVWQPLSREQR